MVIGEQMSKPRPDVAVRAPTHRNFGVLAPGLVEASSVSMLGEFLSKPYGEIPTDCRGVSASFSRHVRRLFSIFALLSVVYTSQAQAECDRFVSAVGASVDRYQAAHRVDPEDEETLELALRFIPRLWVFPGSAHPIDFEEYLDRATLRSQETGQVIAGAPIADKLTRLSREEQCDSYLESPEISSAKPAPVYIQAFADEGPDGSPGWIYLKYTYVFDWSGLASRRGLITHVASALSGGDAHRWHRLDVHTSAILALDASRGLRTVTLQQHNNKRTYVTGIDFDPADGVHLSAARVTNELYLDSGSSEAQSRRAVPSFLQWPYLIRASEGSMLWQMDEFVGRNAGAEEVSTRAVFSSRDAPLATFAGLLAPPRRILGFYVGRDGPPGYDFTGTPEMPRAVVIGYWQEEDETLLALLAEHLAGFETTNWAPIRSYLGDRLGRALNLSGVAGGLTGE